MELKEEDSVKKSLFTFIFEKNGFIREWILPIIAAMALALLINKFVVYNVYIPSESMVPTLNVGDKLVVTKIYDTSKIQRGDVIVFYSDELQERLNKIYEVGPRTNPKAYRIASEALKINEDMTLHNEEIDLFLPDNLKRKNKDK